MMRSLLGRVSSSWVALALCAGCGAEGPGSGSPGSGSAGSGDGTTDAPARSTLEWTRAGSGAFELTDPSSALSIRVRSPAHASASARDGVVTFDTAPSAPEATYVLELPAGVAGLRKLERTLELVDAEGIPRLRTTAPELVGADGVVTSADLTVLGCAVDTDAAPAFERPPVVPGADHCELRVSWDATRVAYPARLAPGWSSSASLAEPRYDFASLTLTTGRVLVAGGLSTATSEPLASVEVFDPESGTWSVTGSLNTARSAFTLHSWEGGDGQALPIALGGLSTSGALASTERYDVSTSSWSPGPELPAAYARHASAQLANGDLVVAGGTATRVAARLHRGAGAWFVAGELLAEEPRNTLTLLPGDELLLLGPNPPYAQRYDPSENQWRAVAQPASGRAAHTATALADGGVLIVGGNGERSVERYDPAADVFERVGSTSDAHAFHTATQLADGRVAIVGGALGGSTTSGGTEIYEPRWGTWTSGPGTSPGRAAHRAERLADGRVLAIGGVGPDTTPLATASLATTETLDASPPPTVITEYKLPASTDPEITSAAATELWASIARPATLVEGRRYPLLVFLHGNHGTCGTGEGPRSDRSCQYTVDGTCPAGFVVTPNHRGYDYVGSELAARGFVVVSVNANRGITCGSGEPGDGGFNLARGKLLLKHLAQLAEWNRGVSETPESVGVSLAGKLDFTELGMMGHSRGGEGVRAAYEQFRDPGSPWPRRIGEPVVFRALFEIGPVDGQTSRVLNADGTAWTVLLPMCDGDVSDLQGVKPFDRMLGLTTETFETQKSTYVAWGTNHNYFNSEWQESDSSGCRAHRALFTSGPGITGSAEQRQIGLRSMLTFFVANVGVGRNTTLNELFDPAAPLGTQTRVERSYTPSLRPNRGITLEDFSGPTGFGARGAPTTALNVVVSHQTLPEHDFRRRGALISWTAVQPDPSGGVVPRYFEIPLGNQPGGVDLSRYTHLELSAGRSAATDLLEPTPLAVRLVNADGSLSEPLDAAAYGLELDGPVGGPYDNVHVMLQTARIPFAHFVSASPDALRAVRIELPGAASTSIYLASVRAALGSASLSPLQALLAPTHGGVGASFSALLREVPDASSPQILPGVRPAPARRLTLDGNVVLALRANASSEVELELATREAFRAQGDQLVLSIGNVRTAQSTHPDGDLARVVFTLTGRAFLEARSGERLRVSYGANDLRQWDFGPFDKTQLRR